MAEYSKEYLDSIKSTLNEDFSYMDELLLVKEGTMVDRICEGFGSIGAMFIENEPHLIVLGSDPVKLFGTINKLVLNSK